MTNFNEAGINAIFDQVVSYSLASGYFESVNQHEPKSAPGNGITSAVWIQRIRPWGSGLVATSGVLTLQQRIYTSFLQQPFDAIDPQVAAAATALFGAYSADFDFESIESVVDIRCIDLLGMSGESLNAQAGYINIDNKIYRTMDVMIPIIVNDMWTQVA